MIISATPKWKTDKPMELVGFTNGPGIWADVYHHLPSGNSTSSMRYVAFPLETMRNQTVLREKTLIKRPRRTPGEYLVQGHVISPRGDKAVSNGQWLYEVEHDNFTRNYLANESFVVDPFCAKNNYHLDSSHHFALLLTYNKKQTWVTVFDELPIRFCSANPTWAHPGSDYGLVHYTTGTPVYDDQTKKLAWNIVDAEVVYSGSSGWKELVRFGSVKHDSSVVWTTAYSNQYGKDGFSFGSSLTRAKQLANEYMNSQEFAAHPLEFFAPRRYAFDPKAFSSGEELALPSDDEMRVIQARVQAMENLYSPRFTREDRSRLAQDVVKNINLFGSNAPAYFSDLPKLGSTIRSCLDLVRNYDSPKSWARAWLSMRFADRLTIKDTAEAIEAFRHSYASHRSSFVEYSSRISKTGSGIDALGRHYSYQHYLTGTVVLSGGLTGDLENCLAAPYRWDLLPTLENVWDMIPFTFVVDWFVNVSAVLEQIALSNETRFIDAKAQLTGQRREFSVDLSEFSDYNGRLTHVVYSRSARRILDDIIIEPGVMLSSPQPVNYVDGAALLVQSLH